MWSSRLPGVTYLARDLCMKGAGSVFSAFLMASLATDIAVFRTVWNDVEQIHLEPGIGALGSNAHAHDARPDDGDFLDFTHGLFLCVRGLSRFHDGGDALTATDALRRKRVLLAFALEQSARLARDPCARGAQRMTQRDCAAVEVHAGHIHAEIVDAGHGLRGEGFIDFNDINIAHFQPGALERLAGRADGAKTHDVRVTAVDRHRLDHRQRGQVVLTRVFGGTHQRSRCAVGQGRRRAGCDRSRGREGGLEAGQPFDGGIRANAAVGVHAVTVTISSLK